MSNTSALDTCSGVNPTNKGQVVTLEELQSLAVVGAGAESAAAGAQPQAGGLRAGGAAAGQTQRHGGGSLQKQLHLHR